MKTTLLFISFTLVAFANFSCGQTPKDKRTLLLESIYKKSTAKDVGAKDTALLRQMAEVYGDSILIKMDDFMSDTALMMKLDSTSEIDKTKGLLSKYKIEDRECMVGPMNDYATIFTNAELKVLDSILYHHFEETAVLVVVVTLDSSIQKGRSVETLLSIIKDGWGVFGYNHSDLIIGITAQPANLKIIRCPDKAARLTNEDLDKMVGEIALPLFKEKKYFEGTKQAILKITDLIK